MTDHLPINDEALLRLRHGGPEDRRALAQMVASDPTVASRLAEWDRQDAALATLYNPVAEESVPARHRALIEAAATSRRLPFDLARGLVAALALVAFGAAIGWFAGRQHLSVTAEADLATAALRAYATYSVEVAHPVEVPASDKAHLAGWLTKRVGQPITPPDLSGGGFHLLGGRVVPDANGSAALMMYENDGGQRVILYVAPSPTGPETAFRFAKSETAQGFWWVDNQLGCALVGEISRDTLREISLTAYQQIDPA